ncbi:MAG: SagB/ThcOx family dehydrogenase [Acidobacteria bacterium]|nr:SagB/ThcOx family dehydrogenase [Acidobacteriota bacterium]
MTNVDTQAAWCYHAETKHSAISVRADTFYLDWPNKPSLFKIYPNLPTVSLPKDFPIPVCDTLSALGSAEAPFDRRPSLDIGTMAQILFFSAGLTKKKTLAGGESFYFRAAACAGALYPIELYAVTTDIPGLDAGVYHFSPQEFQLHCLRKGDYRHTLITASGADAALVGAPTILILTGVFWRSAWKYRARAYRYLFWDSGMIAANLLAIAGRSHAVRIVMGFLDEPINRLLDLDTDHEVALELVALDADPSLPSPPVVLPASPLGAESCSLSVQETDYPEIRDMHTASQLTLEEELLSWRAAKPPSGPALEGSGIRLQPRPAENGRRQGLGEVILKRGSTRQFDHRPITWRELSTILSLAATAIPADFLSEPGSSLLDIYMIINAVEGIDNGAYFYSPAAGALQCLAKSDMRRAAGYLCLEQPLAADAAVTIFFMADLYQILAQYGNRGYRAVQFEAGLIGGKIYLTAYHLGLGSTGLTFYDDDVTQFFSPHAAGRTAIFVVAVGHAVKGGVLQGRTVRLVNWPPTGSAE